MDTNLVASLVPLTAKVAHVHGDHDPRLRQVHEAFGELVDETDPAALEQTFARIRSLCDGYTPPSWACNSYRRMLDQLAALDRGFHVR